MDVARILSLLPEGILAKLAIETKVNRYSKKLQGEVVFKLLLHCLLSHKDNSLRVMESAYESMTFNLLNAGNSKGRVRYSSISERLSTINADYFEKLYQVCIDVYGKSMGESSSVVTRFDSTIVALSGQLLKVGYHLKGGDAEHIRQLKFTIGFSELPTSVHLFTEQKYTSENTALKEAMLLHQPVKANAIRIFDRGVTSRKTHDELTNKNIPFISRIHIKSKHQQHTINQLSQPLETTTLQLFSDSWIYLYTTDTGRAQHPVRCIRALAKTTGEELAFVSNIPDLSCQEITELYKRRWDIEVFFKFLKQELRFSHLINRSENGIRVMLYVTMIASILVLVYKKTNRMSGFKIVKQKFTQQIEKLLIKDLVYMCGGNPDLVDKLPFKPPE